MTLSVLDETPSTIQGETLTSAKRRAELREVPGELVDPVSNPAEGGLIVPLNDQARRESNAGADLSAERRGGPLPGRLRGFRLR
jgi:hypothetical protein